MTIAVDWDVKQQTKPKNKKHKKINLTLVSFHRILANSAEPDQTLKKSTGVDSAVGNVSDYRCVSDCRTRGPQFDPGLVPYFCGD